MTPDRLRVLVLNWRDTRNPEGGGSEVYIESVARSLARAGHDVTIFCAAHTNAPPTEVHEGVRIVRAGTKLGVYREGWLRLRRGEFGPLDVVVDVQNGVPFFSRLATRVPVVVLVHHVHREQWRVVYGPMRSRIGWALESRVSPRVYRGSRYVAVSRRTREELVELGVDPAAIHVVHNGSEPAPSSSVPQDPCPRVLVLGRLVPHKRVELVLEAAAAMRERVPGLRVAVVGDGWWAPQLAACATRLGVEDIVEFTGFVDEQAKHEQLSRAWVLALPSLKEGWGLVVMEAASHGVPTVAFGSAGGVVESVVDGVTGILTDDEPAHFAAALERLLVDAAERDRLGAAARDRTAAFGWDATARGFAAALADALGVASVATEPMSPEERAHVHHETSPETPKEASPS